MKNRVITYLVIILPFILAACSLFRSLPDGNVNVEDNPDVIIGWNDINYDYERELGEKPALGTSNPDERKEDKKFSDKYSALLGVQLDGSEDRSLITEISEWLGTSYKYGTAEKQKGTDCSGFVSSVFRQAYGLEL
ncbi:MAG: NlpC/P60 family protein, partial [Bacteroidota bacterium]